MTSAAQSASPNQTRRRSTRNRAEVTGHEKQTPSRRGARQLANNNTSSPRSPITRKHQKDTSGDQSEENSAADSIADNTLESTAPKGNSAIGSVDGVESYKIPRKRLKTTATTIKHVEEKAVDEQLPQRPERKQATKKDIITEKEGIRANNHKSKARLRTTKLEEITAEEEELIIEEDEILNIQLRKRKVKGKKIKKDATDEETVTKKKESLEKPTRKRKTKEEKEAEAMPLAIRSKGLQMFIGAHVSSAKGPAPVFYINCRAFVVTIKLKLILKPRSA